MCQLFSPLHTRIFLSKERLVLHSKVFFFEKQKTHSKVDELLPLKVLLALVFYLCQAIPFVVASEPADLTTSKSS